MTKILIFHRDNSLQKVRNLHLGTFRFIHLHKVWLKLLTARMIFSYSLLGSRANKRPMVFWTTIVTYVCIHGFRCFTLILEVWGLRSEVRALLGSVSSLRWALALLTLKGWLLAAPFTPMFAFWALVCVIVCFRVSSPVGRAWWFFIKK